MEYHDSTEFDWKANSYVLVKKMGLNAIELQANRAGLLSLAEQLSQIADGKFDQVLYVSFPGDLEEGSLTLQITKLDIDGR